MQKALDKTQRYRLKRTIKTSTPEQVGPHGRLWTRPLVEARYEIALSKKTIGIYLRPWGLPPQRSIRLSADRKRETQRYGRGLTWRPTDESRTILVLGMSQARG